MALFSQLVKELDNEYSDKKSILISLRSCVINGPLPSNFKIMKAFSTLADVIDNEQDLMIRQQAGYILTDIGNNSELDLKFKIPMDTIKSLINLLATDSDEQMFELQEAIITLLASLCICDDQIKDKTKLLTIIQYRECILYQSKTAKYVYDIIKSIIYKILNEENYIDRYSRYNKVFVSILRSFVYTLICFIPRGFILSSNEINWYSIYGEYILNGLCECKIITDRAILGDVCDGLSTIYILSSNNNLVGGICAKQLKELFNNGQYYMVKKAAKQAVMSIVVEFYIRQAGCYNQFPSELVFQLVKYTGNIHL